MTEFETEIISLLTGLVNLLEDPPTTPSWGRMIADAASGQLYTAAWWMLIFPGMALVLTTLSFDLVGDGLRAALDTRTGGRTQGRNTIMGLETAFEWSLAFLGRCA